MLDSHPLLEVGFEESSMACLMGTEVKTRGRQMFHDRVTAFLDACEKNAARFPGKIYGNKITTEQLEGLKDHNIENPGAQVDVLDLFFNHYLKHVKVVFIQRDGRTCVRSKLTRTSQTLEVACARWNFSVEVSKFLRSRHRNNICLKYEDLLVAPEKTLGPVCEFIGVNYDPQMLSGTMSDKVPKEYRLTQLDRGKLAMEGVPENCFARISEGLRYCGYIA